MQDDKEKTVERLKDLVDGKSTYLKYESPELLTWCGGCGNYNILGAMKQALVHEKISSQDLILCFDVGCNGNLADKIGTNTIHGLHGRAISLASGCKIANPNMQVIAMAGDGATLSEGVNHLIHAVRNDYNIVFLHHNNSLYGLTTGQPSATTRKDQKMNSAPDGVYLDPMNPVDMVLSLDPSFVARTFSGDIKHMTEMIQAGIRHNGFAFIEIFQTCPTYSRKYKQEWYWDKVKYIRDMENYDSTDIWAARKAALEIEENILLGILYQNKNKQNFMKKLPNRQDITTAPVDEVKHYDISELLKEFE